MAWQFKSIGELCQVINGGTPKTNVPAYWDGQHLWVTPAEMGKRTSPYVADTQRRLTDQGLNDCSANLLPPFSVILSSRAPIGHLIINTKPMATNQGCKGLVPSEKIDHKFLYYFLGSIVEQLNELGTGATFRELSAGKLKEVLVPVPTIPEQQRVVAILDETFEGLGIAAANAERNLKNARELFNSYLNDIFSKRGEGWREVSLGQIATVKGGKRVPKGYKLLTEPTAFPYLRVTDFSDDGSIDMSDLRYVSAEVHRAIARYVIDPKDMYLSIAGTIGKTGIIQEELTGANLTENACRLVFNSDVSNRFVYYFSKTNDFVAQAGVNTRVAAQPKLALARLSSIRLGLPSLSDQLSIVDKLDALHEEIRQLEILYRAKLSAITDLKKSILNIALSGRLSAKPPTAALEAVA